MKIKKCNLGDKKCRLKNLLLTSFALIFGLGVVTFSAFRVGQAEAQDQPEKEEVEVITIGVDEVEKEEMVVSTESAQATESAQENNTNEKIDYYLAYPGILPDHPLYWFKMIRDRVLLSFTKKPLDRLERLLLYADKRVGAAEALIKGGKFELGITTADKSEKYLERAINQFSELAKSGEATPELNSRLIKSTLKHKEILSTLMEKIPDQSKASLGQTIEKTEQNHQRLKNQFD